MFHDIRQADVSVTYVDSVSRFVKAPGLGDINLSTVVQISLVEYATISILSQK
jgi:hypothetical protein